MSERIESDAQSEVGYPATGSETLTYSPELRGSAPSLDAHEHANDHFALIYESREEQFAAAIPFIRKGLERDERCLYITYENTRAEVIEAMRAYDIDVDTALDSGQLSIHDEEETYLRNETFDADETLEFIDAAIEDATEEYEALRMTGEMSSVLEEDPDGEELVKCEAKANYLFDDADGIALCQYNRERFPADVIRDVISTHPLLIHDNRISSNVYYTPPKEFFGPEKADCEVDRQLGMLREQTDVKDRLSKREQRLRELAEDLQENEERLQLALEAGEMGMWELDLQTKDSPIRSRQHDRIFGYEEPIEEWTFETFLDHVHPDDRENVERSFEQAFEAGKWEFECRIIRTDGEEREISAQGAFHSDDEGDPVRAVGVVRDVTDRKERERQLRELVERLEESNERLEQFAYAASHDLQEPLRMVSSYLRLIENRYGDAFDEDGEEFLEFAVEGADRMREMIQGLLEYSRVEAEGEPFQAVDLNVVLEDVCEDLQLRVDDSGAEITSERLPTVEGDANQLRQVFQNLLSNAIEYSGQEPPRIHVSAERDGAKWILSVRDEGIGIDPDHADRIFEVFESLHTNDEHAGTGIGLALCERIVERHGGDIWVESTPGEGSTFSVTLPDPEA
ncbi:PAS/PAC sensor signal transduction histidine kinase [Haloterrigena turkmenica DSM 5511]|uniref:histidine kinase n=1 Tax=Haloterrigena turkmenica (strain ATCC 51198 / DSM 5511 / JCM 9101 / NCIMB 13204 / VKM B-1734 / 4k) TaxID=543526 RepID=D2RUA2_HALTV|nr:MEDS domain-containing protein [Haloterrigena turkmenica]ADB59171.1 PAS/PAC sensor signal transduction histidine kinase [Haloterrigena turkmenica DSM 5511]